MPGMWKIYTGSEKMHSLREVSVHQVLSGVYGCMQAVCAWRGKRVL